MDVERFNSYLRRPNAPVQPLVDWLQGYGMTQGPQPDTPFVELDKALSKADDSSRLALTLSHRLARVLGSGIDDLVARKTVSTGPKDRIERFAFKVAGDTNHPTEVMNITWPEDMAANGLFLAGALRYLDDSWPERVIVLAPSIKKLLEDRKLSGYWSGIPLTEPLRVAVMTNQTDESLLELWRQTMQGKPDSFLGGQIWDGFRGIVLIPGGGLKNPRPLVREITQGLKLVRAELADQHDGARDYDYLLSQTARTWPDHPNLKTDLIRLAE